MFSLSLWIDDEKEVALNISDYKKLYKRLIFIHQKSK